MALGTARDITTWDSYVEGPRWALPSGWLEKGLIEANATLRCHNLQEIEIVSVREHTSFLRRTIIFKLRGERASLAAFIKTMETAVREYNAF